MKVFFSVQSYSFIYFLSFIFEYRVALKLMLTSSFSPWRSPFEVAGSVVI